MNKDLRKKLDEYKVNTYSKLELSIYYYIRLLELLSIDDDSNLDIKDITLKNNKINTNNFIKLYTCILNELGVEYTLKKSKLTFEIGEYILELDSNIHCINKNRITRKKFDELLSKIKDDIEYKKESEIKFQEDVNKYQSISDSIKVSFKEKLYILLKLISETKLKGEDLEKYETIVFNNLFGNDKNTNIHFTYGLDDKHNLVPTIIISYLNKKYKYIIVRPNMHSIDSISKDELKSLLSNKETNIPGLEKK